MADILAVDVAAGGEFENIDELKEEELFLYLDPDVAARRQLDLERGGPPSVSSRFVKKKPCLAFCEFSLDIVP